MALDPVEQPAPTLAAADVVGAHPPGDRQEPHPHRCVPAVAGEFADRPHVRVLDEVLDLARRSEGDAHLPDGRLGEGHELAEREWARLGANDSLECRNCHSAESMDITRQSQRAVEAHERFLFTGERTCIDCHKGIAHRLPDMAPTASALDPSVFAQVERYLAAPQ